MCKSKTFRYCFIFGNGQLLLENDLQINNSSVKKSDFVKNFQTGNKQSALNSTTITTFDFQGAVSGNDGTGNH